MKTAMKFYIVMCLYLLDKQTALAFPQDQVISLEYKPNRPFYHPNPGDHIITQIVPPGKPWPADPEGYQDFSQTSRVPTRKTTTVANRFKDETTTSGKDKIAKSPAGDAYKNVFSERLSEIYFSLLFKIGFIGNVFGELFFSVTNAYISGL